MMDTKIEILAILKYNLKLSFKADEASISFWERK